MDEGLARILPALVLLRMLGTRLELDESIAVEIAVCVDPAQATQCCVEHRSNGLSVACPAPVLRECHGVEGRRRDGCVVAAEGIDVEHGERFAPRLVKHPVRLLLGPVIGACALGIAQQRERAAHQVR